MPDEPHVVNMDRYEWERVVRRCVLPTTVKAVAAYLAQYANKDGTRIYPGAARLAAVTGMSERSARAALGVLRDDLQLITRTRKGSSLGRQALADEYKLTRPSDLMYRIHMLDPDESPESAACDLSCRHLGSPAARAGDNPPADTEHRQLTTGSPANGARTPATDDRITGTTCTPPIDDPHTYPPTDQPEDHFRNLSTEGPVDLDAIKAELERIDELDARRKARAVQ